MADLQVEVMGKDEGVMDDYIGKFTLSVTPGTKEVEIEGTVFKIVMGTFWIKIESTPLQDKQHRLQFPYLSDGLGRYSRHYSPTVGLLTNLNDAWLYSTFIKGVPLFFRGNFQPWNRGYKAAQSILQGGPASLAVWWGIQAGHRLLYARAAGNAFSIIEDTKGVVELLHTGAQDDVNGGGPNAQRVKLAVYTYIISAEDDTFRFSETGAAFVVDFASKHALHSNCAEVVRYSGQFHPRPEGGWQNFSESTPDDAVKWEFVIDNNSGTYAPDKMLLPEVKEFFEFNFPGLVVHALDREDERLVESGEACRAHAPKWRGVRTDELQPHVKEGEVTLCRHVSESGQQEAGRVEDNFT
ncbi:hypothetical protein K443DRAFT_11201 [Laccaria amethystina LaAM-08-1]|uniref:Uncharacterized protein n=1 Tax=Laccaria amethystina LaAM-08-1 TaxID=1095629 RepID=A0A0C9X347_9AGAR|nr:hypothetical protein K443DRAFT_11201 [Laccaria amethystina LaAM-08-1]